MRALAAALAALLCLQAARAHEYFTAYASDTLPTSAQAFAFQHAGVLYWKLNVTDAPAGTLSAAIVDGNPSAGALTNVAPLVTGAATEGGDLFFEGSLSSVDPAAGMPGGVPELAHHMGMGHIWLELKSAEGAIYGAFEEMEDGAAFWDDGGSEGAGVEHSTSDGDGDHETLHRRLLRA